MKEVKVVVRDLRKEISEDLMKSYEKEFFEPKKNVKQEVDEHYLLTYEKMPKLKLKEEVKRKKIKSYDRGTISDFQCHICSKYFTAKYSLDQHIHLHFKPSTFNCKKCSKTFEKKKCFKKHICKTDLICPHCQMTLSTSSALRNHIKRIHNLQMFADGFKCDYCGDCFQSKIFLRQHIFKCATKEQRKKICDKCGKGFYKKNCIKSHMLSHLGETFECEVCHQKLKLRYRKEHFQRYHPTKDEKFQCKTCSKNFFSLKSFKDHVKTHELKLKCSICDLKLRNKLEMRRHIKVHEDFRCKVCGVKTKTKQKFEIHLRLHDKNRVKHLKCDRCDYAIDDNYSFKLHLKHHRYLDEKLKKNPNAIKCEKCPQILKTKDIYMKHLKRKHQNAERFHCDLCGSTCAAKLNLKQHFMRKHLRAQ